MNFLSLFGCKLQGVPNKILFFSLIDWRTDIFWDTLYLEIRPDFKYVLNANAKEFPDDIFTYGRSCKDLKLLLNIYLAKIRRFWVI